ncbi:MAG: type IV toxin-antitoxin system AbiEi family antitoxin [Rhodobacter sp.]|nr:type IV toxin-antitoxin system AbiEi family antitoxin [Rhodobacter sp.]
MKQEISHARDYVDNLASSGRYHFTSADAKTALSASPDAVKQALNRLSKQGLIATPARGFYVIVPPKYKSLGCLPADQFVPQLMTHLQLPYYAGLLTAAQYYGAAHQRPQEFQAFAEKPRRPIKCGKVRVAFIARKRTQAVATRPFNTPRGVLMVSTPEATAIDLAGYPDRTGGLEQSATVISELAEQLDPDKLVMAAKTAPIPWAQRLGYMLKLGAGRDITGSLQRYVRENARDYAPLALNGEKDGPRDQEWKLVVNEEVEPEF